MIDQRDFYEQLTRTLTPHALRESPGSGNGGRGCDISTWVCDFSFVVAYLLGAHVAAVLSVVFREGSAVLNAQQDTVNNVLDA